MRRCVWSRNNKNRRSIYIYDISRLRVNHCNKLKLVICLCLIALWLFLYLISLTVLWSCTSWCSIWHIILGTSWADAAAPALSSALKAITAVLHSASPNCSKQTFIFIDIYLYLWLRKDINYTCGIWGPHDVEYRSCCRLGFDDVQSTILHGIIPQMTLILVIRCLCVCYRLMSRKWHCVHAEEPVFKTVNPMRIFSCLAHTSFLPQSHNLWKWGIPGLHNGLVSSLCRKISRPAINLPIFLSLEINWILIFAVFWDVKPGSLLEVCWNFIRLDDGGNKIILNVGTWGLTCSGMLCRIGW